MKLKLRVILYYLLIACLPGCATCSNGSSCDTCIDNTKNLAYNCSCPTPSYNDMSGIC